MLIEQPLVVIIDDDNVEVQKILDRHNIFHKYLYLFIYQNKLPAFSKLVMMQL